MKAITCQEMKQMDSHAIHHFGIPSIVLMENAALKVIKNIDLNLMNTFIVVCGTGNNGGDGLAVARHLILNGKYVEIFIVGSLEKSTQDFNINLNILRNMNAGCTHIKTSNELGRLMDAIEKCDLTVDAIFGIGLQRKVEGLFYETIEVINRHSKEIIAVDIPSGLDGDTGKVLGIAVKANKTVTFHLIKKGLVDQRDCTGEVIVEDIGIPKGLRE